MRKLLEMFRKAPTDEERQAEVKRLRHAAIEAGQKLGAMVGGMPFDSVLIRALADDRLPSDARRVLAVLGVLDLEHVGELELAELLREFWRKQYPGAFQRVGKTTDIWARAGIAGLTGQGAGVLADLLGNCEKKRGDQAREAATKINALFQELHLPAREVANVCLSFAWAAMQKIAESSPLAALMLERQAIDLLKRKRVRGRG